jgi:hypothetical protein
MDARDNTKDLIELLGGNDENAPYLGVGWGWYAKQAFYHGYHVTADEAGGGKVRKTTLEERQAKLIKQDGSPKEIMIFDNGGETWDRYTVIYTGPYIHLTGGAALYVGMSSNPFNPQGFGQHGELGRIYITHAELPDYLHLGKRLDFQDLPEDCRTLVMNDYTDLWDLKPTEETNATSEASDLR